ncbi:hypothetical protein PITC_014620 [Penicillium italicum]|uniref:Uncharacterized protein n=1 Tax=Penicillium italicum TaxID=40296 RepID=A0A0A2KNT5_PENIT|nr:hypothetical protein PITC_014620 [Penicillium italicum]
MSHCWHLITMYCWCLILQATTPPLRPCAGNMHVLLKMKTN